MDEQVARLEELLEVHEEIAGDDPAELADCESFDGSAEGERLRRSLSAQRRELRQTLELLMKMRKSENKVMRARRWYGERWRNACRRRRTPAPKVATPSEEQLRAWVDVNACFPEAQARQVSFDGGAGDGEVAAAGRAGLREVLCRPACRAGGAQGFTEARGAEGAGWPGSGARQWSKQSATSDLGRKTRKSKPTAVRRKVIEGRKIRLTPWILARKSKPIAR